jgi:opacity protein-like surface antigen
MRFLKLLPVAVALAAAATSASAAPPRKPAAKAPPKQVSPPAPDVYAGYSYTHAGAAGLNGWAVSGSYPLAGRLRLVLDLTGHYGSFATASLSQAALMGGVRGVWRWKRIRPFAEGLVGFARTGISAGGLSETDTDWGLAIGGGVDYPLSRSWAARGLFHLRLLNGEGTWDTDPRVSVGAVYRFRR